MPPVAKQCEDPVFPAHAGVIRDLVGRKVPSCRVPRTRGGDPDRGRVGVPAPLCSPHRRG